MQQVSETFLSMLSKACSFKIKCIMISDEYLNIFVRNDSKDLIIPENNLSLPCIIGPYINYINEHFGKSEICIVDEFFYNAFKKELVLPKYLYVLSTRKIYQETENSEIPENVIYVNDLHRLINTIQTNGDVYIICTTDDFFKRAAKYISELIMFKCYLNDSNCSTISIYNTIGKLNLIDESEKMITNYVISRFGTFLKSSIIYQINTYKL